MVFSRNSVESSVKHLKHCYSLLDILLKLTGPQSCNYLQNQGSSHSVIRDLSRLWLSYLGHLVYCFQEFFNYLALQYFDIERT